MVNRKGGIGLYVFIVILILVSLSTIFVFTKSKYTGVERINVHDKVASANLALYEVIEQGDKDTVLNYRPDELTNYIKNPSSVSSADRNKIFNLLTAEYFPAGERYKGIYLEKSKALPVFVKYLGENLDLVESTPGSNILVPKNAATNYIQKLTIKEFFVHNAVSNWDQDTSNTNNDIKDNKYTGVHVSIEVEAKNNIKFFDFENKLVKIPIHVDTDLIEFRSKQ